MTELTTKTLKNDDGVPVEDTLHDLRSDLGLALSRLNDAFDQITYLRNQITLINNALAPLGNTVAELQVAVENLTNRAE